VKERRAADICDDSEKRFRALALAVLENEQTERARLARLLHDEVAPVLSGAGLQLDILKMDLEDRVPEIASRTAEIQGLLDRVVKHIRDLSYELNPDVAKRSGLQSALDMLVSRFRRIFPGTLRLAYSSSVHIPVEAQAALGRVAEEAVLNAVRHAQCTQIEIVFEGAVLQVRDNGIGFAYDRERRLPRGLGLLMMEHRASRAGLRLSFDENAGGGSVVSAIFVEERGTRIPASESAR
jgi:signal transduction histidine kinase